jgi:hypothetical protein
MANETYVNVSMPDTVNPFGPISSSDATIVGNTLTVTGASLAPPNVNIGALDVEMEKLTLSASLGSITVNSIQVDLSGSQVAADIANVEIWNDLNGDDMVDVGDALLGSDTFAGGPPPTATIVLGGGFPVNAGTPETLLVVYDISGFATPSNTVGARIVDENYVTVAGPDTVNAFGPLQSLNSLILSAADVLTVSGFGMAQPAAYPGEDNVTLTGLRLSAGSGTITVTEIDIFIYGTATDADIAQALLYNDTDDSGTINAGDVLLTTASVSGNQASFSGLNFNVTSGMNQNLVIGFNISSSATIGHLMALVIMNNANVTVSAPDTVSPTYFPIGTGFVEIIGGNITGTVEDSEGNAIQGANVQLIDTSTGSIIDVVATDSNGNFAFTDQPFDDYTLNVSATGYDNNDTATATIDYPSPITDNVGTIQLAAITVSPPQPTTGEVEGDVYDKDGKAVSGAEVELLLNNVAIMTTTTDSYGHYKFDDVEFGTYSVRISKSGLLNQTSKQFTLDADNPSKNLLNTMTTEPVTPEGEEVVPMWTWLVIVLFLILFVIFFLLFLMGRMGKKPEGVMPPSPEGEEVPPPGAPLAETPPPAYPEMPGETPTPPPGEPSEPSPPPPAPDEVPPPPPA